MMRNEAVRARLDALITEKKEDYSSISRLIGRNPAYIQQFIKRGVPRRLAEGDRQRIAQYLGVAETELGASPRGEHSVPGTDFVLVPRLDVGASAGPGALPGEERATASLAFHSEWLRRNAGGNASALSVITVTGDSMVPTLSDGDEILVNAADAAERLRDGIYVLRVEGAVMVKRLAINPAGRTFTIRSDNPAYPPWEGCDLESVAIIGRVIWMSRRIG